MEDSKKVYKCFEFPREDFPLCAALTEAALAAKEVLQMIEADPCSTDDVTEELQKQVATVHAIVIQGLSYRPFRMCLGVKDSHFKIWNRLRDRSSVSNTATKVQLQTTLSRMSYSGQSMQDYIGSFEAIFHRLSAMQNEGAVHLQVAILLASFGDKIRSAFGHLIASPQNAREDLDGKIAVLIK